MFLFISATNTRPCVRGSTFTSVVNYREPSARPRATFKRVCRENCVSLSSRLRPLKAKGRSASEVREKRGINANQTSAKNKQAHNHRTTQRRCRYVRRSKTGQFKKEVNVSRSLAPDRRRKAKTKVAKGQGDRGDTKRSGNVVKRLVRKFTRG